MPENRDQQRLLLALPFVHFGVGRLAADLARAASAACWNVDVLTCGSTGEMRDDPRLLDEILALGGRVHHADIFSRDPGVMRHVSDRVAAICHERRVAAIHAFTAPAAAAALRHRPVLASVVGWSPQKSALQRRLDAAVLERCDIVTSVSEAVSAELRRAGLKRPDVRVILNGVALEPSRKLRVVDPAAPLGRIGVMAHLIERKGADVLIRAMARLDPQTWESLDVAGHGEAEKGLRALSAGLLPPGRVTWLGVVSTETFFDRVDIVVVPSRADALPLVLLQAMAYGRVVVASAVDGISEAVSSPDEALLVPAGDDSALARALRLTLADPPAARRRACAARRRVERDFSLDACVAQYVKCYAELSPAGLAWPQALVR
jgi:glycosyltransferase involved in cell wall biosynthesis